MPNNISINKTIKIWQTYLAVGSEEVRIRKIKDSDNIKYMMSYKEGGRLKRKELEFEISKDVYMQLAFKKPLEKTRREVVYEGDIYEVDIYHNENIKGLMTAEIEFNSTKDATIFIPPQWLGEEVTYNDKYKNQSLWVNCNEFIIDKYSGFIDKYIN